MIEPRIPSSKKTSAHSIKRVTNIADPTLSPNRKYSRGEPCKKLRRQYRLKEAVIGIDIGGVLVSHEKDWAGAQKWHRTSDSIVPGALRGLSKLIFFLGASKVFLISFAEEHRSNGGLRKKIKDWLHKEICICAKTGLLKKQHHLHE